MHLLERWKYGFEEFMDRHRGPAVFLATLFVIGVVFGALAVRSLPAADKQELVAYLGATVGTLDRPPEGAEALMLRRALAGNAKLIALIWVLGVSVIGVVGILVLTFLRGFLTGFVVAFLAAEMGLQGVLLATAGHLPQSLLEVPAMILAGTASIAFASQVLRSWQQRRRVSHFYPALAAYSGILLANGGLLAVASLVESYLSPGLVRVAAALVQ